MLIICVLKATKCIIKKYPQIKILVVPVCGEESYSTGIFYAGAFGYKIKKCFKPF